MRPCQVVPVLLLLLGLAKATTPRLDGSPTTPPTLAGSISPGLWVVNYRDVVLAAVELLNAKAFSPYVLRLQDAKSLSDQTVDLQQRQQLSFAVEETTCRAPGMATTTTTCKSRWLGAVTRCQGWVFLEQQQPMVELSCEKVPTLLPRIRTSRLRDIFTRIKERFRGFFQCSKIWIRDKLNLRKPNI